MDFCFLFFVADCMCYKESIFFSFSFQPYAPCTFGVAFIPWPILSVALSGVTSTHTLNADLERYRRLVSERMASQETGLIIIDKNEIKTGFNHIDCTWCSTVISNYYRVTSKVVFHFSSLEVYQIMCLGVVRLSTALLSPDFLGDQCSNGDEKKMGTK